MNNINLTTQTSITPAQPNQSGQTGQIFKNQPSTTPQTTQHQTADKQALENIDRFINKVINEIKGANTATQTTKVMQMAQQTKIAPDLANELQNLAKMIDADDGMQNNQALKDLATKLKEFLKPIADLKTAPLNEQIKNSGIMLEANLKEALNPQKIPQSMQKLLSDIKNLSNQNLLNQILTLAKDENLDNNKSFLKLNEILKNEAEISAKILNNSALKGLFSDVNKLDNIAKFLDKTSNLSMQNADKILNQMSKLNEFTNSLNNKISLLNSEKLNQLSAFSSNLKELKSYLNEISSSINALNKIGDEAGIIKNFQILTNSQSNSSLQDKLSAAAKRLSVMLNIADLNGSNAKSNLNDVNLLTKQLKLATADVDSIQTRTAVETTKTLSSDIKSTLLSIQEKSSSLNNAQQINQLSSKMLSQIEMHQIISSVSGGLQTYLPYIWDGVDGGKVAFKQGKKDKFYAQIDLNFKEYGQVNVMIGLINKRYIDISIATTQNELKDMLLQNNKELKTAISDLGLIVSNFNLKVYSKNEISQKFKEFDGFEVGINKKA
ncbi:hypothetical protein LMG7974_00206 [Campylobacter majalis]|uniref:Flagellar hook-length control protein-like C-terminal domain-containing protein n=1 Tax=Campylobacter majalis TaxID=2790656 RepID=A0ABM8Q2J2_9BACT|nr:flagellar hook-length control protein FliK [Campylobacter majalis]CAD7287029.1 hypothetical protein LMG7974_00206 [Campylobacter majalis]